MRRAIGTAIEVVIDETHWQGLRLVVAHHPERTREQPVLRRERIAIFRDKGNQWAGKIDGQDAGVKVRGRKLSDSGAKVRMYHEVCEAHLARIVKVDLKSELFISTVDAQALAQAVPISGIAIINTLQAGVMAALNLKKPTQDTRICL